jgi:hypothetical protein
MYSEIVPHSQRADEISPATKFRYSENLTTNSKLGLYVHPRISPYLILLRIYNISIPIHLPPLFSERERDYYLFKVGIYSE